MLKRFFWVVGRNIERAHMVPAPARRKNPVEGDKTLCGRIVTTGWRRLKVRPDTVIACGACEKKVSGINVARVR